MATPTLEAPQSSVVTLISGSVSAYFDVVAISDTSEFQRLAKNLPACGVVLELPEDTGVPAPADSQYLRLPILVVITCRSFRSGQDALSGSTGIYELFASTYSALVGETPTNAWEPIRYVGRAEPLSYDETTGTVVGVLEFTTTIIL